MSREAPAPRSVVHYSLRARLTEPLHLRIERYRVGYGSSEVQQAPGVRLVVLHHKQVSQGAVKCADLRQTTELKRAEGYKHECTTQ